MVSIALVRDQYEGRAMARVMSFVMTVFILVRCGAHVGQSARARRSLAGNLCALSALGTDHWGLVLFISRKPWSSSARLFTWAGSWPPFVRSLSTVLRWVIRSWPVSFRAALSAISIRRNRFFKEYGLGARFPSPCTLALALGTASFLNARLVMRFGMPAH
ncbi:MAG: hypothetical protein R2932_22875 [Caldilineaceae bacterium]